MAGSVFVSMLVKPLVKSITTESARLVMDITTKGITKAAVSYGLKELTKGKLTELDALNIARAAVDKKMLSAVADSLGMSRKELRELVKRVNMTERRVKAVKGRNFMKNVNKYLGDKAQTSIKNYIKNIIKKDKEEEPFDVGDDLAPELPIKKLLEYLDKHLKAISPDLGLSQNIWDNINQIQEENIYIVLDYLENDFYYMVIDSNDNPVYLDKTHQGYKGGLYEHDFMDMIENMLLNGYYEYSKGSVI